MMRVLLVDDEPLALDRLKVGFDAIEDVEVAGTASDGVEAVEKIRALEPDLIILDIQMPGRSGMEIARALRPEGRRPEIIFVTAFDRFATDAFEVEAADYLLKPVAFDRLRLGVCATPRAGWPNSARRWRRCAAMDAPCRLRWWNRSMTRASGCRGARAPCSCRSR
jgi:DNA-binding LytR/AlgR family response regulator